MNYSVAIPEDLNSQLLNHLVRKDGQEDLVFCLWKPSTGNTRVTALINEIILPEMGEREIHGNASFNPKYFERVAQIAITTACGIAFLHSHPVPGWQGMSEDDVRAENKINAPAETITDLPLLGMTVGTDGYWSARIWEFQGEKGFIRKWCPSVRVVGTNYSIFFNDCQLEKPKSKEIFKRTIAVWGETNHANISRMKIGIVGLGSVGMVVAEILARMGIRHFSLIDFDEVQLHNLDRLLGATIHDINRLKVEVAKRLILNSATADGAKVNIFPFSIAEIEGYGAGLDCDLIFCCVDRPRARRILDHFAFSHLIPVIDGGVGVRFREGIFAGVDWQAQTVAPGLTCLECLGQYTAADVSLEIEGKLDDPSYIKGLPNNHKLKNNENVFPFSVNLASMEVLQFVEYTTNIGGLGNFGVQRFRYIPGIMEACNDKACCEYCDIQDLIATGDTLFALHGCDVCADISRSRQNANSS